MKKLFFTTVIALMFLGCSNDDDDTSSGTSNKFTYLGETTGINIAEYHHADDDLYLYFSNSGSVSYVVIIFEDMVLEYLDSGTYSLDDGFSLAYITTDGNPLGDSVTDGELTVMRNEGNSLKISFELTTANGTATGQYEGEFTAR